MSIQIITDTYAISLNKYELIALHEVLQALDVEHMVNEELIRVESSRVIRDFELAVSRKVMGLQTINNVRDES